jgi:hypothetical protein
MKKWFIKDPVYGQGFFLVVGGTITEVREKIDKWTGEKAEWGEATESYGAFMEVFGKDKWNFLWLKEFDWTIKEQGVFVHELNHHCNSVFESLGLTDRKEAYAYYFEMMFKRCYEKLKPKKKKR